MSHNLSFKIEGMKPTKVYFNNSTTTTYLGTVPSGKVWQWYAHGGVCSVGGTAFDIHGGTEGTNTNDSILGNTTGWASAGQTIQISPTSYGGGTHGWAYEFPAATQTENSSNGTVSGSFVPEYGY